MKRWIWFLVLATFGCGGMVRAQSGMPQPKAGMQWEVFRGLAIQEGGRKKPLDSFARESARTITGRENFAGFDPVELLFSWLTQSRDWEKQPILEVGFRPLLDQVHL